MLIFPARFGVVSLAGQVLANVKIVRTFQNEKTYQQITYSDSQGRFSFDSLTPVEMTNTRWACWNRLNHRLRKQWFSSTFISDERITVQQQEKTYIIWQRDYLFSANEPQPSQAINAELSEQKAYFQYLDWDNIISSCCDLQLDGQKRYLQLSQRYQDQIEKISADLYAQLSTPEALVNAAHSFVQTLENISLRSEQGLAHPPEYDPRLLAYSKLDGIHIEVLGLELRLQQHRFSSFDYYLFWRARFAEQYSISGRTLGYILYRIKINGREEQFLARSDEHKVHFDCETFALLGTEADTSLFLADETALIHQHPSESQPLIDPFADMG